MVTQKTMDALTNDAVRGSLYEVEWRDSLDAYVKKFPTSGIHRRAVVRLKAHVEPDWPESVLDVTHGIGLGTYGWTYDSSIIETAMLGGIQFIDTAETYGCGRVEEALGPILSPECFIATKVSHQHLSRQSVYNAYARSVEKLGRIDLYQVHWPNPKFDLAETMAAMSKLMSTGKIQAIGLCNVSWDQLCAAQVALSEAGPHRIDFVQVRYNLLDRQIEDVLLPYCLEHKVRVIAYSPLGQNFKTILQADRYDVFAGLGDYYDDATPAQIALAWCMHHNTLPIPRTNNIAHAKEIAEARYLELELDDLELLDESFN